MKETARAWRVCIGCAMILFCTSGLAVNAFTVYQPYILQYNGFTNTQSSDLIMLRSLFSFFAMFLTGRYYKIFSYRIGLFLSGLLAAVSFLCFGLSRTYLHYCACIQLGSCCRLLTA